jgi:DNA repair exonuclease SbcCD ATPase subunit
VRAVSLTDLQTRIRRRHSELDRRTGMALALARAGQRAEAEAARARGELELDAQVSALFTSIGEKAQADAQVLVEGFVTRGLQVVFSENLSFRIVPSVKRGQAELDFVLTSTYGKTVVETPVMEARGGGMAAVVGFVLRLVVLLLTPGSCRFLALDESFAHVSESFVPRVAEFLKEVTQKADVQILLVTHSSGYGDAADQQYRLAAGPDGTTQVFEGESELWQPSR